jgi:hypothetical protein
MDAPSLAAQLGEARARAAVLDAAPWRDAIADVADAYHVQSELAQRDDHRNGRCREDPRRPH